MNVDLKLGMGLVNMRNFLLHILLASFFVLHCVWLNEKYLQLLLCFSVAHSCESVGFVTFNLEFESTLLFHFIHMCIVKFYGIFCLFFFALLIGFILFWGESGFICAG